MNAKLKFFIFVLAAIAIAVGVSGCYREAATEEPEILVPPEPTPAPTAVEATAAAELEQMVVEPTAPIEAPVSTEDQVPGQLAWSQNTNSDGYEASPVGELGSSLPILAETWGKVDGKVTSFVVVIPAGSVAWFQNHYGGTGWWITTTQNLPALAENHQVDLVARDGISPTVAILPEDGLPLLGCLQSKAVVGGVRHCDAVGLAEAFYVPIGEPFPGYFPTPAEAEAQAVSSSDVEIILVSEGDYAGEPVEGPTILQTFGVIDQTEACRVIQVNEGTTFEWLGASGVVGHWWRLNSQAALEARFPSHLAEAAGCVSWED